MSRGHVFVGVESTEVAASIIFLIAAGPALRRPDACWTRGRPSADDVDGPPGGLAGPYMSGAAASAVPKGSVVSGASPRACQTFRII